MTKEQFDSLCILDKKMEEVITSIALREKGFANYDKEEIYETKFRLFNSIIDAFHLIFDAFKAFLSTPIKSDFSVYVSTKVILQNILNSFCKIYSIELTEEEKTIFPTVTPLTKETIPSFLEDMIAIFKSTCFLILLSFLDEEKSESERIIIKKSLIDFYHLLFNFNELERMIYPLIDFDSIKDDETTEFETDKSKS